MSALASKDDLQEKIEKARSSGFSDEQIQAYLINKQVEQEAQPQQIDEKIAKAKEAGFSDEQIQAYLMNKQVEQEQPPEYQKGLTNKAVRLAGQGTLGLIENAALPLAIPGAISQVIGEFSQPQLQRQEIFKEIEDLITKKQLVGLSDEEENQLKTFKDFIENPDRLNDLNKPNPKLFDIGSVIEEGAKLAGVDLSPKTADEMALRWLGFIKNPAKLQKVITNPLNVKNLKEMGKALIPSGSEIAKSGAAGYALSQAAYGQFGPTGTLIALALSQAIPDLVKGGVKGAINIFKDPQKYVARALNSFKSSDAKAVQKQIIEDFKKAGIQADIGTLSNKNFVKWIQSTLAQSGLTGEPLEKLKKQISENFVQQYKEIAETLGQEKLLSKYDAGEVMREASNLAKNLTSEQASTLYKEARQTGKNLEFNSDLIVQEIDSILKSINPGNIKSTETSSMISKLKDMRSKLSVSVKETREIKGLKKLIQDPKLGQYAKQQLRKRLRKAEKSLQKSKKSSANSLMNDRVELNKIIKHETQGGMDKKLYGVIDSIDRTLEKSSNKNFVNQFKKANKNFERTAKIYRNKTLNEAIFSENPAQLTSLLNSVDGLRKIEAALKPLPRGDEIFRSLKRYQIEQMIGKNMRDSVTHQLKFGTFAKLLEKKQNREVLQEILGKTQLRRLENIMKASGRIEESAQKFFNASKSGSYGKDAAVGIKIMYDFINIFNGNPFPFIRSLTMLSSAKRLAKLMSDPEFIKRFEQIAMESKFIKPSKFNQRVIELGKQANKVLKEQD